MKKTAQKTVMAKRPAPRKHLMGAVGLLEIANLLRVQIRRAENLATWREKIMPLLGPEERGRPSSLLRAVQVLRDADVMYADRAFFCICCFVLQLAEDDPAIKDLSAKMKAIQQREGLAEDRVLALNDPETPEDYKEMNRRQDEIIAAILKQYGEDEIAGLLLNDHDAFERRLAEAIVQVAKRGGGKEPESSLLGFGLVQTAIVRSSRHLWEDLWNDKHPDRYGQAWDGEDSDLMRVWREKVQAMIKDCRQEAVLGMTYNDYAAKLIDDGASKETAEELADSISDVVYAVSPDFDRRQRRMATVGLFTDKRPSLDFENSGHPMFYTLFICKGERRRILREHLWP